MQPALSMAVRRARSRFKRQRAPYYEYLAQMLEASRGGIKILELLERDADRYAGRPRGVLCAHWAQVYAQNGSNLADTLQGTLPDDEVAILRIAQDAGDGALLAALQDVARIARLSDQVKSAVLGTLAAGIVGLSIALAMLTVFPIVSSAKLLEIYGFVPLEQWGPQGKSFVGHAERIQSHGLALLLLLGGIATYVHWTINHLTGPARDWLDRHVVLYRAHRDIKGALFLATMATLTRRRGNTMFTLRQSLETFGHSVRSPWLQWRVQQVLDNIDATGATGSEVFDTGLLAPPMFFYLRDLQEARGFAEGFQETGKHVEGAVIRTVLGQMTLYRWLLLMTGVVAVVGAMGWQYAVIYEMKSVLQSYFSSR